MAYTFLTRLATIMIVFWAAALPVFAQTGGCANGTKCLENPLKFGSIEGFIEGVLKAVVMIALPIIVAFMVFAGFKYIAARGNPGKISEANKNFVYVLMGTVMILGAWVLATLIGGTVTQLLGK